MKIKDIMTPSPLRLSVADTIADALLVLSIHKDIRHLPIMDGEEVVGMVSERDLRAVVGYLSGMSQSGRVKQVDLQRDIARVMTRGVLTVSSDDPLLEAARQFGAQRIGALPVVDDGQLVGIVSYTDLINHFVIPILCAEPDSTRALRPNESLLSPH